MSKIVFFIISLVIFSSCKSKEESPGQEINEDAKYNTEMIVDSLLYYRHQAKKTDILPRRAPNMSREEAIETQMAMLQKELDTGAKHIGWKMGGTIAEDSSAYDPMFGYILDSNVIEEDSTVLVKNFPGGQVMIEGEIGFFLNKDFRDGTDSIEELREGIDYVVNAVEFAQSISISGDENPDMNHIVASGMGHAGLLIGSGRATIEKFDLQNEIVKCYLQDTLITEGHSSNVFGGPLNALYSLANMLPEYGTYLKKGDIVITGSVYDNPSVDGNVDVRQEYSTLGMINFEIQ